MKKLLFLTIFALIHPLAHAGGSRFDAEVVSFESVSENVHLLKLKPTSTPYDSSLERFTNGYSVIKILIEFRCSQNFFRCKFYKRSFSKEQHEEALSYLGKIAKPGYEIKFGVLAEGFRQIESRPGYFQSNGLYFDGHGSVYSYYNSHL